MKKSKGKTARPFLGKLLQKIAPRIGARVVLEPEWNVVGQIVFRNGRKRYFRFSSLDLNSLGASEIARDKDYADFFMKQMGYPTVPDSKTFFSREWAQAIGSRRDIHAAYRYARSLGFPVYVKPNSGSRGVHVRLVYTQREFYSAMRDVFRYDCVALVQRPVSGRDYRIVVVDAGIISAYERIPLNVVGDGSSTIRQLLERKQNRFAASGRDTVIKIEDSRIRSKLVRQGMTMRSVPRKGAIVTLLDIANLSAGGDAVEVSKYIHPGFKKLAIQLTKDMGLRLCGVDLIVEGDIRDAPGTYLILEVNSAPGLDHYAQTGKAQKEIVENLYLKVLKSMAR